MTACQAHICLAGPAGPHLPTPIIPTQGQASRDLSHLTLNVFIFMKFRKQNERLSGANGGVIEPTWLYEIAKLFQVIEGPALGPSQTMPKVSLETKHIFTIAKVIYVGKSFHQKVKRRKPVFCLFEESHMVDADTYHIANVLVLMTKLPPKSKVF